MQQHHSTIYLDTFVLDLSWMTFIRAAVCAVQLMHHPLGQSTRYCGVQSSICYHLRNPIRSALTKSERSDRFANSYLNKSAFIARDTTLSNPLYSSNSQKCNPQRILSFSQQSMTNHLCKLSNHSICNTAIWIRSFIASLDATQQNAVLTRLQRIQMQFSTFVDSIGILIGSICLCSYAIDVPL